MIITATRRVAAAPKANGNVIANFKNTHHGVVVGPPETVVYGH